MRRGLLATGGVILTLLLVVELIAVPVTERVVGDLLTRCGIAADSLEVTDVSRPLAPRLLLGRARGVELTATGLRAGDLRVAEARLTVPEARLPWALGGPTSTRVDLDLVVTEADLQRAARDRIPLGLPVTIDLDPGVVRVGASSLPVTVDVAVELDDDGTVRFRPVGGDAGLLDRLGLAAEVAPAELVRLTALTVGDGEVSAAVRVTVVPSETDEELCAEPLV